MLTKKIILKLSLAILGAYLLTACSPIYKPRYYYSPPSSNPGMMCIAKCTSVRNNCEQLGEIKKDNCETQAERAYQICKQSGSKDCYRKSCYNKYKYSDRCVDQFNECYQSCGGTVKTQQVCTAFCN